MAKSFAQLLRGASGQGTASGGTSKAKSTGLRVGTVTANDPATFMVKVTAPSVHEDGKEETHFAPVMQPMMGSASQYGHHFLPEVGDQVILGFLDGDMDKPLVLGGAFTEKTKHVEKVTASADDVELDFTSDSNDGRAIVSRAHSHLLFWDEDGKEIVELRTKQGHVLSMQDEGGKEKIQLYDKDRSQWLEIDVKEKKITLQTDTGEIYVKAKTKITMECEDFILNASKTIKVESGTESEWVAGTSKKVETGSTYDVEAGGAITIQGPTIDLNP